MELLDDIKICMVMFALEEKNLKYASIASLAGNPLYYWSHLELKNIF